MTRTVKPATGTARLEGDKLTITTTVNRGKKTVKHTVVYTVEDVYPTPSVAFPAFSLTKAEGTVYHVAKNKFGAFCDCANFNYRNHSCKHVLALQSVGLLPKEP